MSIAGVINGQASVTAILRGSGLAPVPIFWTAASDAVDGYNIYRGSSSGNENFKVNVALITGTSFTDYNAPPGINYYVVKSSILGVESQVSNEVSIVILGSSTTGHATVGGIIHASGHLVAVISRTATVAGLPSARGKLASAVAGHASVSGSTTNSGFRIAHITGQASTSAALKGGGKLASPISRQAIVTGLVVGSSSLTSAISGHATVGARTTLFSNPTGHASVSGFLRASTHLVGSATGHASVSGTLEGSTSLSDSITGHATVAGTLKGKSGLVGSSTGHATVTGTAKGKTALVGAISGQASVQLVENLLAAIISNKALVAGTLTGKGKLADAITGHASVSGTVLATGILIGSATGHATVGGVPQTAIAILAGITGVSSVSGTVAGTGNIRTFILRQAQVQLASTVVQISGNIAGHASVFSSISSIVHIFSAIAGHASVVIRNVPFIANPVRIGLSIGRGFACSFLTPALVQTYDNTFQLFSSSLPVMPIGTADGWGNLGQRVMQDQLLIAPGNGRLPGRPFVVVAVGDVVIPFGASSASVNFILNQNYFTITDQTITTYSFPMSTLTMPAPLSSGVYPWSIVSRLADNGSNNGFVQSMFTVTINGITSNGVFSSNINPFVQPQLQFSMGVQFGGTSGLNPFQAHLFQFEMQQA